MLLIKKLTLEFTFFNINISWHSKIYFIFIKYNYDK